MATDSFLELDVSNDPEIERLGANATIEYADQCWERLCRAARQDGRLLDALWNDDDALSCPNTKEILWTATSASDHALYRRFRSHFPAYFWNVEDISIAAAASNVGINPLAGTQWTALLLACEGVVPDYNFMTLLRPHTHHLWNVEVDADQSEYLVVPRAQFICIELARCKEGYYHRSFREMLQLYDVKTIYDILQHECLSCTTPPAATRYAFIQEALLRLSTEWPYPSRRTLKETGIVRTLQQCLKVLAVGEESLAICSLMQTQLQTWKDLLLIRNLSSSLKVTTTNHSTDCQNTLQRLLQKVPAMTDSALSKTIAAPNISSIRTTQTTSDPSHVTVHGSGPDGATCFADYGLLILTEWCDAETIGRCHSQAEQALQRLQEEQLTPRQLQVQGTNAFDFVEVRQRPGHRIDNRYTILDDPESPIVVLGRRLLAELPPRLFAKEEGSATSWKLLYAGVVHSFPRQHPSDPAPPAQFWHRDGPSLFTDGHHPTHCFNVFVPLVNVNFTNGTTEFVPGTHDDQRYHNVVADVLLNQAHPDAGIVRADVNAGSIIVFDIRVLHRGLSNASNEERPVLYFTFSREWFQEQHMFQKTASLQQVGSTDWQFGKLCDELYISVTGTVLVDAGDSNGHRSFDAMEYGHPHYTTRFDLLLWEHWRENDSMTNCTAALRFCRLSISKQEAVALEFLHRLTSVEAVARKQRVLENARQARAQQPGTLKSHKNDIDDSADFASIQSDMSDVVALYELTAELLFKNSLQDIRSSQALSSLGFTEDEKGICVLLAMLKARANSVAGESSTNVRSADLEECFSTWWNASPSVSRFHLIPNSQRVDGESNRKVLVVFSSLGSGLARPEWYGTLRSIGVYDGQIANLDVLHVMDFAYSWYCQDPTCSWKGGDYYARELQLRLEPYSKVMFLGDSMGGSAALRFSHLAQSVLAFTPQIDIVHYEAVTRLDFTKELRETLRVEILNAVFHASNTAHVTVHFGSQCAEDVRQVQLLRSPSVSAREHLYLVEHEYDDHVLSLHLREQGTLVDIVRDGIEKFLQM